MDAKCVAAAAAVLIGTVVYVWSMNRKKKLKSFLDRTRQDLVVVKREELTSDVRRVTFALPQKDMVLGLPVGKHVKIYGKNVVGTVPGEWNGREDKEAKLEEIERNYTPTSVVSEKGSMTLVFKVYFSNTVPRFPDGGKMSQQLDKLRVGDHVEVRGPFGRIEYSGRGAFKIGRNKSKVAKRVGMIAGGTGITPMFQVLQHALNDPEDDTEIYLLFANVTESDILLREELETMFKKHEQFKGLHYTLDRPPTDGSWKYSSGFVNEEMVRKHIPSAGDDAVVLCCGPPPMIKYACTPNLLKANHEKDSILIF